MSDVWKKFEDNGLTHSSVHHLMAIDQLLKTNGYARGIDVAKHLDISRSSVSVTLHKLQSKGYIVEDENKFYHLTEEGRELTHDVLSTRRIVKKFFLEVLDLPENIAEEDACKVEHLLHLKTSARLFKFISFVNADETFNREFRKRFKSYKHTCSDDCDVCDDDCFYEKS
ncbi:MAG: metal-dependent transcriptional regulator [Calditrichaeota bacterium]|nr:MAG: metal-dependent transcriptional regulator [Calditrichota bacterium]